MSRIDPRDAAIALSDIDDIVRRVRQSRIYNLASLIMILWGMLVVAGNIASHVVPSGAARAWIVVYLLGIVGSFAISAINYRRSRVRTFDLRVFSAFLLFIGFGVFVTVVLGQFGPRQLGAFWAIYFMLAYSLFGLWFGYAFVAIGISVTALTLIGYFSIFERFDLWMAMVNGGGLILGGLWMRRS